MFKIASWNVNSLSVRLEQVMQWLETTQTDVLGVQETKLVDERFPSALFRDAGYHVSYCGQKTYNGVALISREPLQDIIMGIPGFVDEQRRVIAATIRGIRVINIYVPNGAAVGTDKYHYKLTWLAAFTHYLEQQLIQYPKLLVMGDFNIAPEDKDVHDPSVWAGSVLVSTQERDALQALLALGVVDSFRVLYPDAISYSWWDYRAAKFRRNHGLRIDLMLLSHALHQQCVISEIDVEPRKHERPSDHTPVWVGLKDV